MLLVKTFIFLGTFEIAVLCIQFSKEHFRAQKPSSQKLKVKELFLFQLSTTAYDGGGERDRTDDILRAKQVLSQLSYTPIDIADCGISILPTRIPKSEIGVVGLVGIEPTTSRLSGVRSNRD